MPCGSGNRKPWNSVALAMLLAAVVQVPAAGQIPGAARTRADVEAARFRASVLELVRPRLEAWEDAWRSDAREFAGFYSPAAILAVPGAMPLYGRESLTRFIESSTLVALHTSLLDFEASDRMAYVYGTWASQPGEGEVGATGRHVTVLDNLEGQWLIRSQTFTASALAGSPFPVVPQTEPLPSLAERVDGLGGGRRQPAAVRASTYHEIAAAFAAIRRAWSDDDAGSLSGMMREDALIQWPGRDESAGSISREDLAKALEGFGNLNTVELDFEFSGSLAYLAGRYYVERREGTPLSGNYIAMFRNPGSGWLLRLLVFG